MPSKENKLLLGGTTMPPATSRTSTSIMQEAMRRSGSDSDSKTAILFRPSTQEFYPLMEGGTFNPDAAEARELLKRLSNNETSRRLSINEAPQEISEVFFDEEEMNIEEAIEQSWVFSKDADDTVFIGLVLLSWVGTISGGIGAFGAYTSIKPAELAEKIPLLTPWELSVSLAAMAVSMGVNTAMNYSFLLEIGPQLIAMYMLCRTNPATGAGLVLSALIVGFLAFLSAQGQNSDFLEGLTGIVGEDVEFYLRPILSIAASSYTYLTRFLALGNVLLRFYNSSQLVFNEDLRLRASAVRLLNELNPEYKAAVETYLCNPENGFLDERNNFKIDEDLLIDLFTSVESPLFNRSWRECTPYTPTNEAFSWMRWLFRVVVSVWVAAALCVTFLEKGYTGLNLMLRQALSSLPNFIKILCGIPSALASCAFYLIHVYDAPDVFKQYYDKIKNNRWEALPAAGLVTVNVASGVLMLAAGQTTANSDKSITGIGKTFLRKPYIWSNGVGGAVVNTKVNIKRRVDQLNKSETPDHLQQTINYMNEPRNTFSRETYNCLRTASFFAPTALRTDSFFGSAPAEAQPRAHIVTSQGYLNRLGKSSP